MPEDGLHVLRADAGGRSLVRAAAFALTSAEYALVGRIPASVAVKAIADELDAALRELGIELREVAHLEAVAWLGRRDH